LASDNLHQVASLARAAQSAVHRHPKRLAAAVLTLLAGTAFTAFGVAPLAAVDSAATPTIHLIDEALPLPQLTEQVQALDLSQLTLYRSDVTRSLRHGRHRAARLGVDDPEAARFLREDVLARQILTGRVPASGCKCAASPRRRPAAGADRTRPRRVVGDQMRHLHFTRLSIQRAGQQATGELSARTEQAWLTVQPQPMWPPAPSSLRCSGR
jgi:hypothetical protein